MPNDGGPAFPHDFDMANGERAGMSLRDWFAGMGLQGILAAPNARGKDDPKICADAAYLYADSMLAEREKPKI